MKMRLGISAMLAYGLAFGIISQAYALDAFWHGVRSDDWNDGIHPPTQQSNWYSQAPPNGLPRQVPDGTAIFANGAVRMRLKISSDTVIATMRFPANTARYTFGIDTDKQLLINGGGLINNSTVSPFFFVDGSMTFVQAAKMTGAAGRSAKISTINDGTLSFRNTSRGGNAIVANTLGGQTVFFDRTSADRMVINNFALKGGASTTTFLGRSNGGEAQFENEAEGIINFQSTTGPAGDRKVTAGSIDNAGRLNVGLNTLTVLNKFKQAGSGFLRLTIAPQQGGRVLVKNVATIGGNLVISGQSNLPAGQRLILRAGGGLAGKFAKVQFIGFPAGPKPVLVYSANSVLLKTF